MKQNDLVIYIKDKKPIIYIIEDIIDDLVHLKGYSHRVKMTATLSELTYAPAEMKQAEDNVTNKYLNVITKSKKERNNRKVLTGRILHIDGDQEYLNSCMSLYEEIGIPAEGIYTDEKTIKDKIEDIVLQITPDIVVITGHDTYNGKGRKELNNYENTKEFMETVRKIRRHFNSDSMCVIVGACASNFEALIASGANFASSPNRINIHTYDPAVIAIKAASTSCEKTIDFNACIKLIENGREAFGGIETKGKMKILL